MRPREQTAYAATLGEVRPVRTVIGVAAFPLDAKIENAVAASRPVK